MSTADPLFVGLDSSTQSLKATAVDARLEVIYENTVTFDTDLSEFKTSGGVHHGDDGLTVTSPAIMWVAALDLLLSKMNDDNFPFARVVAVSGSGQQHGSVYLNESAATALPGIAPDLPLRGQLEGIFSVKDSPVWMDSSTSKQCKALETALGGPQAVADLTGSRAYERFTGNQIAKIHQSQPDAYDQTARICLVSSFTASLLIGGNAPIDLSDGSGMNLMGIRSRQWEDAALNASAPDLAEKLGTLAPSHAAIGRIHGYYCKRYGFQDDCEVIAFSGDNPNSLAALRLQSAGDVAISLGTSDTVFGSLDKPSPSATEGHIFVSPVDPKAYMALICYKNGSLTREDVRDRCAGGTWQAFDNALANTPPGNGGAIGFYIKEPEITPPLMKTGIYRFDADDRPVESFAPETDVRAVVEGQFISMRLHGANVGLKPTKIFATGGASANRAILTVMADVFGVPVHAGEQPGSAAIGAAYRAMHGWQCIRKGGFVAFEDAVTGKQTFKSVLKPDAAAHTVYTDMLGRYAQLECNIAAR
jgi:xylulokinase